MAEPRSWSTRTPLPRRAQTAAAEQQPINDVTRDTRDARIMLARLQRQKSVRSVVLKPSTLQRRRLQP